MAKAAFHPGHALADSGADRGDDTGRSEAEPIPLVVDAAGGEFAVVTAAEGEGVEVCDGLFAGKNANETDTTKAAMSLHQGAIKLGGTRPGAEVTSPPFGGPLISVLLPEVFKFRFNLSRSANDFDPTGVFDLELFQVGPAILALVAAEGLEVAPRRGVAWRLETQA